MNVTVIQKPAPHCPIPFGHPLFAGFVPAKETDIRRTWARSAPQYGDDYDRVMRDDWLSAPGGFR
jgi:hypothetical protein